MSAARLLHLLLLLETRERVTARELASALEVSVRTVHRDIEALSGAGVPVYAERGAGGGFRLLAGRRFEVNGIIPQEAAALPFAGLEAVARELGVGDHAAAAWLKVESALPPEVRAQVQETAREVHIDLGLRAAETVSTQLLRGLRDAVRRRRVIAVRQRVGGSEVRTIAALEPLGLVRGADGWQLVARGPEGFLALRVASIELARATGADFERDQRFDLARWWERSRATIA